jgi:hypothetical protein
MIIRALFRQEFDRIVSKQSILKDFTTRAVEWFADDSGDFIGAIAHQESDLNWSIVILVRKPHANFRAHYLDFGFWNCDDARQQLFDTMEMAIATRGNIHAAAPVT